VEVDSCGMWDVGFPTVSCDDIKASSAMSGKILLSLWFHRLVQVAEESCSNREVEDSMYRTADLDQGVMNTTGKLTGKYFVRLLCLYSVER
jgi:hypothetical protein